MQHRLGHHVRGGVPQHGQRLWVAVGEDAHGVAVGQRQAQVAQFAVHLHRHGGPCQPRAHRRRPRPGRWRRSPAPASYRREARSACCGAAYKRDTPRAIKPWRWSLTVALVVALVALARERVLGPPACRSGSYRPARDTCRGTSCPRRWRRGRRCFSGLAPGAGVRRRRPAAAGQPGCPQPGARWSPTRTPPGSTTGRGLHRDGHQPHRRGHRLPPRAAPLQGPAAALQPPRRPACVAVLADTTAQDDYRDARRLFSAGVSHELRTPLARILALVDTLALPLAEDERARPSTRCGPRSTQCGADRGHDPAGAAGEPRADGVGERDRRQSRRSRVRRRTPAGRCRARHAAGQQATRGLVVAVLRGCSTWCWTTWSATPSATPATAPTSR